MIHTGEVQWCPFGYDLAPPVTRSWAQVYYPVRVLYKVQMMFYEDNSVTRVNEPMEYS